MLERREGVRRQREKETSVREGVGRQRKKERSVIEERGDGETEREREECYRGGWGDRERKRGVLEE